MVGNYRIPGITSIQATLGVCQVTVEISAEEVIDDIGDQATIKVFELLVLRMSRIIGAFNDIAAALCSAPVHCNKICIGIPRFT